MEKKLKINFILKGVAVFAFVAFCLLAILAGVTLPFVSNASMTDCSVASDVNDCATASAQTQNLIPGIDYTLPAYIKTVKRFSDLVVGDKVYGFALDSDSIADFWSITTELGADYDHGKQYALRNAFKMQESNYYVYLQIYFDNNFTKFSFIGYNTLTVPSEADLANVGGGVLADFYLDPKTNFSNIRSFCWNYFLFPELTLTNQIFSSDVVVPSVDMTDTLKNQFWFITEINTGTTEIESLQAQLAEKQNQIDTLTAEKAILQSQLDTLTAEKNALQAQLTEKQNQIDTLTAEKNALQTQLSNMNFSSHFGNFDGLGSSDFYVNLSTDIVLPEIFYQYTNNSTPINGWFLMGSGANTEIYGLNLFDRFYYNGTQESGFLNCGFQLTIKSIPSTTMPPTYTTQCKLHFVVSDTLVWSADCDTDYNTDTKVETITNIRNGTFKVSSNYDKDTNVYKFTAPSDKVYLLNENYNKAYDTFRSYVVQQDYKKTRIPSDNALYLNGYQSASKDFYNNGYNDGVAAGEKSGYNKGFTAGDAQGYNRGVEVGGNYSFLGLFGAIFDAPINALFGGTTTLPAGTTITDKNGNTTTLLSSATVHRAGLLNFEVMGVNLSGFVLALFSISIIVVVIKFALAKR